MTHTLSEGIDLKLKYGGKEMIPKFKSLEKCIGEGVAVRRGDGVSKMKISSVVAEVDASGWKIRSLRVKDLSGEEVEIVPEECWRSRKEALEMCRDTIMEEISRKLEWLKRRASNLKAEEWCLQSEIKDTEDMRVFMEEKRWKCRKKQSARQEAPVQEKL